MMQASFKTPRGTLINAKGDSEESFRMSVAVVHDRIPEILEVEQKIAAAGNVVASGMTGATPPPPPPPSGDSFGGSFANAAAPLSSDGQQMVPKTGNSAKGPWKGWFDARGKGYDQPKFMNRGTPEWDNFPA